MNNKTEVFAKETKGLSGACVASHADGLRGSWGRNA